MMDHTNHIRLAESELTKAALDGVKIYGPGDETIGTVNHTHGMGASAEVVLEVGGFLGIGAKEVVVPASDIEFMRDTDGTVHGITRWTKDDVKALPSHDH